MSAVEVYQALLESRARVLVAQGYGTEQAVLLAAGSIERERKIPPRREPAPVSNLVSDAVSTMTGRPTTGGR